MLDAYFMRVTPVFADALARAFDDAALLSRYARCRCAPLLLMLDYAFAAPASPRTGMPQVMRRVIP